MKLISGVVRRDRVEEVKQALSRAHIYSLKISESTRSHATTP